MYLYIIENFSADLVYAGGVTKRKYVGISTRNANADWITDQKRIKLLDHFNATLRPDESLAMRMTSEAEKIVYQHERDLQIGICITECRIKSDTDRIVELGLIADPDPGAREAIGRLVKVARAWSISDKPSRKSTEACGDKVCKDSKSQKNDPEDGAGDDGGDDGNAELSILVATK